MSKKALVEGIVKYLFEKCDDPVVLNDLGRDTFAGRVNDYLYHTFDKLFHDKNHSASPLGAVILDESPEFVEFWSQIHDSHDKSTGTSLSKINKISYSFEDDIGFKKYCRINNTQYPMIDRFSTFKYLDLIGRDDDGCGHILITYLNRDVSQTRHEAFLKKYKFTEAFVRNIIDSIRDTINELKFTPLDRSDARFIVRESIKVYLSHKDQSPEVIRYLDTIKYDFEEYDFLTYYAL